MLRISLRGAKLTKATGAGAAGAMLHPRHHEEAHECLAVLRSHLRHHALVIVDGVHRGNRGVAPAMVDDQFSAALLESGEIRVGGIQSLSRSEEHTSELQ